MLNNQDFTANRTKYLGGSDPEGAQRATQAMLQMKKIDLAKMKSAYEGR